MTAPPASGATGVKARLEQRLAERAGAVFLRADFNDLGGYAQVGRALRALVEDGRLLKMGYGMYARAQLSRLDGKPMPTRSIRELAAEALGRLGVETVPTTAEEDYNSGRSVQVPTGRVIGVRQRVRRKIIYGGVPLWYQLVRPRKAAATPEPAVSTDPIPLREALHLIWTANRYPILGNEDWAEARRLERAALARAAFAVPSPDDPPELAPWLATLLDPACPADERDDAMSALYDFFDPEIEEA